jgi:hypothetical protein
VRDSPVPCPSYRPIRNGADLNTWSDKEKRLRRSGSGVDRGARRGNGDPRRVRAVQRRTLKQRSCRSKYPGHPGKALCVSGQGLPRWGAIGFAGIHPHGWLPTRRWHRQVVDLSRFSAIPVAVVGVPVQPQSGGAHCQCPCQPGTYQ